MAQHSTRSVRRSRSWLIRATSVLLIVEELDIYLQRKDKSLILNVLDGMETPNNPRVRSAGDDELSRSDR